MDKEPGFIVTTEKNVIIIAFNRPRKKNAILMKQYDTIVNILDTAACDENIALVVITGSGESFTSGNDFSLDAMKDRFCDDSSDIADSSNIAEATISPFQRFITAMINFEKPIIAVVNGPAVGIGVTLLGLCDVVFASDKATFQTPFVSLGLLPEGCSSYLFPRILGYGKASEMLMFGEKITASEALNSGLVTRVFPHNNPHDVWRKIFEWSQYSPKVLMRIKNIIRSHVKPKLHEANKKENEGLQEVFQNPETIEHILTMLSRKKSML